MRAIKTTISSILAVGLLAGSTVGVAAQEGEAAAEAATPAKVTGSLKSEGQMVQEPTETVVDGVLEVRGFVLEGDTIEMDDPRLTGSISVASNVNVHKESDLVDIALQFLALRVDNDAGSWTGQGTNLNRGGANISDDEATNLATMILTGAGAYEGLSAYLIADFTADPSTVEGAIFAGDFPPFPELPTE